MDSFERVERILTAMLLHQIRDLQQAKKADTLSKVGFTNQEIASLLGTTAGTVGQQLYELRASGKRKAKGARKKK
jgi:CRP-like cAMP-binding protein